jgi:type III secretion system HrpE/YscL family protein
MSGRVLRADRRGPALVQSEVMDARRQAAEILQHAEQRAAALREQARVDGYQAGLEQAAGELLAIVRARSAALEELEPQAIEVALMAARQIIGREIEVRPEQVAEIVAPLLQRVRRASRVVVRIHPADRPAIEGLLEKRISATISIEPDAGLARGDCVIDSDIGKLDARIAVRLSALARALQQR